MSVEFGIASLAAGFIFGLALAVPPGPMNAIIAEESVTRGWYAGAFTGFGAMLADIIFFVLAVLGAAAVLDTLGRFEYALYLVGGLIMLVFAMDAGRAALSAASYSDLDPDRTATGFQKAFILGLTNPVQLAFWLTVGVTLVRPDTIDIGNHTQLIESLVIETGSMALIVGFFLAVAAWITLYPAALVALGRRVDAAGPIIALISAVLLTAFGLSFLWLGVTAFL